MTDQTLESRTEAWLDTPIRLPYSVEGHELMKLWRRRCLAAEEALTVIDAQRSNIPGSTARADCMAAMTDVQAVAFVSAYAVFVVGLICYAVSLLRKK